MGHSDIPFVDKNSERLTLSRRVQKIIEGLQGGYLFPESREVGNFSFRDGQYSISQIDEGEWRDFGEEEFWGYPECYAWFRHSFTIPESFAGKPVVYEAMPYPHAGWDHSDTQFILYANGKLVQGMDSNHKTVRLLEKAEGGERFDICLNAYTDQWSYRGPVQMKAKIKTMDDLVLRLIFDLQTPLEVSKLYQADELPRIELVKAINEAVNLLNFNTRDYETFAESAKAAIDYLDKEVYGNDSHEATAYCIGHTHIDVAWLWRLRQTRDKIGRSFATVLKLMEQYPEYKFMSPQAQLYDYAKQDYPELFEDIKKAIADGRWEAEGSMWVEADTNVTSGESLVRQFLFGKRFFKQEFGVDNKIMWLPDVFGYSAALPQIMKRAGIDYFMTTKISWNEYNRLPYDTFMWKGIDGTEILSHFSPSTSGDDKARWMTTYNANLRPDQVLGGWRRYSQKDLNKSYLCTFGYGDGGGGPTLEMLEHGRRMEKGILGCPKVRQEFSYDFFTQLEKEVKGSKRLDKWVGELYLEFHRGTLTAQARNKRYNRKSELLYHDVETLCSLAQTECGDEYPREKINEGWKIILLNQFHDIIPGSSIKEVYDDSKIQYDEIIADGVEMAAKAMNSIASGIRLENDSLVVFNTLGFERSDVVITEMPEGNFSILDAGGFPLPFQKTHDGKLAFFAKNVPSKGYKVFKLAAGEAPAGGIKAEISRVENRFYEVEFDESMNISRLFHKASGRAVAPEGEVLNRLIAFEDKPFNHEAWDVKSYIGEKFEFIDNVESAELIENGPVRAVIKVVRRYYESTIEQFFIFYNEIERIDVDYVVDWKESDVLLKADYPVDVNALKATFDIQFGNFERSTHNNSLWDFAQFEVSGHRWVDLSDNSFGLSILNDCKYGNTVKDGRIRPTLLRSATKPNWAQDREMHYFTYAIYPHAGFVNSSDVVNQGYSLNVPLYCVKENAHEGSLEGGYSFICNDAKNVVIETVKVAEDSKDIIIRAYETWNRKTDCIFTLKSEPSAVFECNLIEENEEQLALSGKTFALSFKPFEIKTFKITL